MNIGYGIIVQESDDPYISAAEEAMEGFSAAGIPGTFWVDLIPILKYVPSWFPGAGFQKQAARWKKANHTMAETPFNYVKEQLVQVLFFFEKCMTLTIITLQKKGTVTPSVAASLIERLPDENDPRRPMEESVAKNVAFVAYAGMWCNWAISDV